jgi:hypothetical protein
MIDPKEVIQGRDIELYDNGGDFIAYRPDQPIPRIAELRRFLWDHWRQKRRGYVRDGITGMDHHVETHYFVEPDAGGKWQISCRTLNTNSFSPPPPPHISDWSIALVEQAKPDKFEQPGDGYVLVFCDREGKDLGRL